MHTVVYLIYRTATLEQPESVPALRLPEVWQQAPKSPTVSMTCKRSAPLRLAKKLLPPMACYTSLNLHDISMSMTGLVAHVQCNYNTNTRAVNKKKSLHMGIELLRYSVFAFTGSPTITVNTQHCGGGRLDCDGIQQDVMLLLYHTRSL